MTNGRLWTDGQLRRLPFPTSTASDMKGLCAEVRSWRSLEHILTASIQRRVHPKSDCSVVWASTCPPSISNSAFDFKVPDPALSPRWWFTLQCAISGISVFMAYLSQLGFCSEKGQRSNALLIFTDNMLSCCFPSRTWILVHYVNVYFGVQTLLLFIHFFHLHYKDSSEKLGSVRYDYLLL